MENIKSNRKKYYKLLLKQNWYKMFVQECSINRRCIQVKVDWINRINPESWIDYPMCWDSTSQGMDYWCEIHHAWRKLVRNA